MRLVICWTDISGYMAACWRALQPLVGHLHVIAYAVGSGEPNADFNTRLMSGLSHDLLPTGPRADYSAVAAMIERHRPDAIVVPGWASPAYIPAASDPRFNDVKFIMTMDTPLTDSLRQKLGRWRLRGYLGRMSRVVTAGERAAFLARRLGFTDRQILIGLYGFDYDTIAPAMQKRLNSGPWPRRFLYTGRYCDVKAIDVLVDGYRKYRSQVDQPWPLTCCGSGPDKPMLQGQSGVDDRGFVQPQTLPDVLAEAGAFVLASRYEPWGVVVAEAGAAGLPVVCSDACGAAVECVRTYYSGLRFPSEDSDLLASRLKWIHDHHAELPLMGRRAQQLAEPQGAIHWARRWAEMLREL